MLRLISVAALTLTTFPALAQLRPSAEDIAALPKTYSPYVERSTRSGGFAENLLWGDTHLHTSFSMDAGMIGTALGPADAYRFARGETVTSNTGQRVRAVRPLDFLVVADHAENLGVPLLLAEGDPDLLNTEYGRRFYDLIQSGDAYGAYDLWGREGMTQFTDVIDDADINRTTWDRQIEIAEEFNEPGVFTAMLGFEWTMSGTLEDPGNLHRVVVFRDGADKVSQVLPFSLFDGQDVEQLWAYMQGYEDATGGQVLAIPHNGNVSNGKMFAIERMNGEPINADYARMRMRWEPLVETTQIKGDSEAHPFLSPEDEFADYGTWDKADIGGIIPKKPEMLPHEYTRTALQIGLQQLGEIGENPFKMGQIGSSDSHTALSTTRDENFFGKMSSGEPSPDRHKSYVIQAFGGDESLSTFEYDVLASGLAAVWARENTREAIFDAMQRKEVYATTGTRITVRLFGGWDYAEEELYRPDVVEIGYDRGVPMGGDLPPAAQGANAPVFMVGAMKDAWSGNLDRIQIIKGWVDAGGQRQERIYDVAVSDRRKIGADGRATGPVGNTVDEAEATWTNTIGAPELRAVWKDPDFDPSLPAVYYARVLEIPTPTWQAYDEKRFGIKMEAESVPRSHQERAYTSPIWYTPEG
ncbi:DUF3604 domain-containing protein [Lutimaribacter marinistellae]|uniref:DUF3604 domain-containing protein n=1 Tax=Lutimaribacter marinistellae TaxID=1820329 RepID=A0ABV7TKC9_9RHOB